MATQLSFYFESCADLLLAQPPFSGAVPGTLLTKEGARRLFDAPGRPVPLWLSPLSPEQVLLGQPARDAAALYRACGLSPLPPAMPDHLGLLFRFLAWCCRGLSAPGGGAPALFCGADAAAGLLRPALAALEQELTGRAAPAALTAWCKAAAERLAAVPASLPAPAAGAPLPPPPPGFGPAAPAEPRRVIPTSGWGNCGGRCIIRAEVEDGAVLSLSTQPCGLTACGRGRSYRGTFLSPYRLRQPLRRIGKRGEGHFAPISWDEATTLIAREVTRVKNIYGPGARYVQYATGVSGVLRGDRCARRLLALDGGYLDFYNNYSEPCARTATAYTYGTFYSGSSPADYVNAKLILLWGFNPAESGSGTGTMQALAAAAKAGVPIVSIDPRFTDTAAALGAKWVPLRPATDAALALAMAWVLLTEGLADRDFLARCCLGFDTDGLPAGAESVSDHLLGRADGVPKTPEWAAAITGVPANTIRELALSYGRAKPAALLNGYGPQRHGNGEQTVRACILLACMTGNVGLSGGGAAGMGRIPTHEAPQFPLPENPFPGSIPCFQWTRAAAGPGMTSKDGLRGMDRLDQGIKLIFNLAGNTLLNQHGDVNATRALLADESKVEFIVCSDLFLTPSARYADLLLPGVSPLESANLNPPWEKGDYLLYSAPVIPPLFQCRPDYDWLAEVAEKLGLGQAFTQGRPTGADWLPVLYDELRQKEPELPDFSRFTAQGGFTYPPRPPFIAFRAQREEGVPFPTTSGKVELYSPALAALDQADIPPIPKYIPPAEGHQDPIAREFPLQLIAWHEKGHTNSTHDNNVLAPAIRRPVLWLHPQDAAPRGIADGSPVRVFNRRGQCVLPACVTPRILPGTAAMPQGGWFAPDKNGVDRRGCINVLTSQRPTPLAFGNGQNTALVEVEKWEGPL